MKRRQLDLHNASEVISEIERLRSGGYTRTKNWNLTQICEHLNATMVGGMEGFGFRLPRILRATLVKWGFDYSLKNRKLLSGAPTFPSLKPKADASVDDDAIIDACIQTCQRADTFDGSLEEYPLLDNLTADDWRQFMWLHAAHHLSFLLPKSEVETGEAKQIA